MSARWAIFGVGVVGRAVREVLIEAGAEIIPYDVRAPHEGNKLLALSADVWFVCVPTPSDSQTRRLDLGYLAAVFHDAARQPHRPLLIVKSTIGIGGGTVLAAIYDRFAYVPEWLIERAPSCREPARLVIGANSVEVGDAARQVVRAVPAWQEAPLLEMSCASAELVKIGANAMLAAKVGLANELAELCGASGADWSAVRAGIAADPRIGDSHLAVPGPDGRAGFGGTCFPKDSDDLAAVLWATRQTTVLGFFALAEANRLRRPEEYPR